MKKIAIVAPSPVPFSLGGAENIYLGLQAEFNSRADVQCELIKVPVVENTVRRIVQSYLSFLRLDLDHFDMVISMKYPAWAVRHRNHVVYMQHKLRGLYDTYFLCGRPFSFEPRNSVEEELADFASSEEFASNPAAGLERILTLLDRIPEESKKFPGPLARYLVHRSDDFALGDGIKRYCAISRTVAERPDYFPADKRVDVIYHPSSLVALEPSASEYFFTASRLENAKRIDLILDAYIESGSTLPLYVAGDGPERVRLQERVLSYENVKFLGRISSERLSQLYANCRATIFCPFDEDFGLVALEAMKTAKPVLTTNDAGGCAEIIEHERTGYIVSPRVEDLSQAILLLANHPQEVAEMGRLARHAVADITWPHLADALMGDDTPRESRRRIGKKKAKIGYLSSYTAYDARAGGPLRVKNIFLELSKSFDVVGCVVSEKKAATRSIAHGFSEHNVELKGLRAFINGVSSTVNWAPVDDIAAILYPYQSSTIAECSVLLRDCAVVVLEHPYLYPLARRLGLSGKLVLDCHNVEYLLKRDILPKSAAGIELATAVLQIEKECVQAVSLAWTCSHEDWNMIHSLYSPYCDAILVPNGVMTGEVDFVHGSKRTLRKQQLGFGARPLCYFIGSWHGPNISAAHRMLRAATFLKNVNFAIAGSVCEALTNSCGQVAPANVALLGRISQSCNAHILSSCDIGLNPMYEGSGTNLKLFEYAASGSPIVTTPFGIRGSDFVGGVDCTLADISEIEEAIVCSLSMPSEFRSFQVVNARKKVERLYDWVRIAESAANGLALLI